MDKGLHFFSNGKFAIKSKSYPHSGNVIELKPSELAKSSDKLKSLKFMDLRSEKPTAHVDFSWWLASLAGDYGDGYATNKQRHFDYLIADLPIKIVFFGIEIPEIFKTP